MLVTHFSAAEKDRVAHPKTGKLKLSQENFRFVLVSVIVNM